MVSDFIIIYLIKETTKAAIKHYYKINHNLSGVWVKDAGAWKGNPAESVVVNGVIYNQKRVDARAPTSSSEALKYEHLPKVEHWIENDSTMNEMEKIKM